MNNLENREIIVYGKMIRHMKKLGITPSDDELIRLFLCCKEIFENIRTNAKIQINL